MNDLPPSYENLPPPSYYEYLSTREQFTPYQIPVSTSTTSTTSTTSNTSTNVTTPPRSKRCKNCGNFYHEQNNVRDSCAFHPGKYLSVGWISNVSTYTRWSCCKKTQDKARGCKISSHVEDLRTSLCIEAFDAKCQIASERFSNNTLPSSRLLGENEVQPPKDTDPHQEPETVLEPVQQPYFFKYTLKPTDTLQGIALRNQTTTSQILRDNNIVGDSIYHRHWLWIRTNGAPPVEELKPKEYQPNKKVLELRFQQMTKCLPDEARCYLKMNDFDFGKAIEAYKDDLKWEDSKKKFF